MAAALVRGYLPDWQDRKQLRASCRQLRAVVDALAEGSALHMGYIRFVTEAPHEPSSARLLRQLQRLVIRADGRSDADGACWCFGALHLSALTQLTRLKVEDRTDDDTPGGSGAALSLVSLLTCTPLSLHQLCVHVKGRLHPADVFTAVSAVVSRCSGLESLQLVPEMEAHSLAALIDNPWPKLRALKLTMGEGIDDAASMLLLARLTQLTKLVLCDVRRAETAAGLVALSELVALQDLQLRGVAINGADNAQPEPADGPPAAHWFADVLRCTTALTRLELTGSRHASGLSVALPAAAYGLLSARLVELTLEDADFSADQAARLMVLLCLQALTARGLQLDGSSRPCFRSLTCLLLKRGLKGCLRGWMGSSLQTWLRPRFPRWSTAIWSLRTTFPSCHCCKLLVCAFWVYRDALRASHAARHCAV